MKNQYERTRSELDSQVKQAENNYRASQVVTKDYSILSRIDGRVYQLFKEPGELVSQQEPVAMLGSASTFIIEMLIDEVDIVKIAVGMKVLVTLDAYEGEVFLASLNRIYPQKNERTQTFKVEALFDKKPPKLYPGLSGEANIIRNEKQTALIIPRSYLIEGDKVNTETGLKTVETGVYNMEEVEIIAGIDSTTTLLKPS